MLLKRFKEELFILPDSRTLGQSKAALRWELAAFAVITTGFLLHALYLNVPAEDAFITFRFARNFAEGHGLVWNIGEQPVEGYTNFLWLLISALAIKSGLDVVIFTQALGVLLSVITIGCVYRFSRRIFALPRPAALIPSILLAVSGPFATWAASSLETNLFTLLLLLGCYGFASWLKFSSFRHLVLAQVALFLASLTRPEGVLVFAVLAGMGLLLSAGRSNRTILAKYLGTLLVYAVPFFIYFLWRFQYFGYLLPNTFYAKTGGGLAQYLRGLKYSLLFALFFVLPLAPVAAALVWESKWSSLRPDGGYLHRIAAHIQRNREAYSCAAVVGIYTLYITYVGGDYMAMFRFFVPILPLIYLIFGLLANSLFQCVAGVTQKQTLAQVMIFAALSLTMLQSLPIEQELFEKPWFMHGTYRGVQHERWHVARNTLVGEFFRSYIHSEEESLALLGIGIIPYVTNMNIESFHGIVDPAIAHKDTEAPVGVGMAGHEKVDLVSVILRKPTYIMVDTGDLYLAPQPFPDYPDEIDYFVRENYTLKAVWLNDVANQEAGYLTFLELKGKQASTSR